MRSVIALLSLVLLAPLSFAEVYEAHWSAPSKYGAPRNYGYVIEVNISDIGTISGEIKTFYGSSDCQWAGVPIKGKATNDGFVQFVTEDHAQKFCGRIAFSGKKEGDKLVGFIPNFGGQKVDVELKPK